MQQRRTSSPTSPDWIEVRRELLRAVSYQSWSNYSEAEDAVQEAIARYLEATRYGRVIEDIRNFLFVTARNFMIDRKRKDRAFPLDWYLSAPDQHVDERLDAQAELARLDKEKVQWLLKYHTERNHPGRDRVRASRYRAYLRSQRLSTPR